ncbi:MAG TPA: prepilin-type N-terminal cleavage/methylation domain-containing protein [Gemmatimonadaceae bacterium]
MASLHKMERLLRATRSGFTVIELIVVMVVVSIVMALALPRVDITRYRADGRVQIVRKAVQQAQRTSLVRQHDVIVSFDTTRQRMRVALDANNDGAITAGEIITWQALSDGGKFLIPSIRVDGSSAPSNPIDASQLKSVSGMPSIVFHRDGSVSADVTIYFSSGLASPTEFRAVRVLQGTGRTDWFRFNGTVWSPGAL